MSILRRGIALSFFLATALPAQNPPPAGDAQDSAELVDRPETDAEKRERLLAEYRKLKSEFDFLQKIESGGGLVGKLKASIAQRTLEPRVIDDPGAPQGPVSTGPGDFPPAQVAQGEPQQRKARLLGDEEKAALPAGTIMTVQGLPVSQEQFDEVYGYLKALPTGNTDDSLKTQALETLIRMKAAEAAFPNGAKQARDRMVLLQQKIAGSGDFAAVAREQSDCPSKNQGGDLGWFGRSGMDTHFTIAAFGLQDGETSKPVQTQFGYHLIKRTGFKKADDANQDQVRASHILAMYDADQFKVRQVQMAVSNGEIDVGFVSDDYRKLAPAFLQ